MKYWVTYKIDARYIAEVDAESVEESLEKAQDKYLDADFGACKDIEGQAIAVADNYDNIVWEW